MLVRPPSDLDDWLSAGMAMEFGPGDAHVPCRFPAMAASALVVVTEGRFGVQDGGRFHPLPQALVSGPSTRPLALHRTERLQCLGLMVRPQAAAALFGDSPALLVDRVADACDVFQADWRETVDRLLAQPAPALRLRELFAFVRSRVRQSRHGGAVSDAARLQRAALLGVSGGAARLGCSTRQLERRFGDLFGLAPKRFQRIARAEAAMRELLAGRGRAAGLAADLGYFDQSHLGRDLRELGGLTAAELAAATTGSDPALQTLRIGAAYGAAGIRPDFRRADFASHFS